MSQASKVQSVEGVLIVEPPAAFMHYLVSSLSFCISATFMNDNQDAKSKRAVVQGKCKFVYIISPRIAVTS